MALVNPKKIKFAPLLCALVVLICCIPVQPATAAETASVDTDFYVSGFWRFNEQLTSVSSPIYQEVSFESAGASYSKMSVFVGALHYCTDISLNTGFVVTNYADSKLTFTGDDYRLVYFGDIQQPVSSAFYAWLQANASQVESTFDFDGSWYFDSDLSFDDSFVITDISFESDSLLYYELRFRNNYLWFVGDSNDLAVWNATSGWLDDAYRVIHILEGPYQVSETTWIDLNCNAVQMKDPSTSGFPVTSVTIDGEEFTFTYDETASPDVFLRVASTGVTLSSGYRTKTWVYSGDEEFAGVYDGDGTVITPNQSVTLSGASGESVSYEYTSAFSSSGDPSDQTAVLQSGQWQCNSLVMTGEYVDLAPWPDGLAAVSLNFTSSGQSFSSMSGQYNTAYGDCLYYDDTLVYKYSDLTGTAAASWQTEAYALVYLAADQEVPQAFYDWFIANFSRSGSDPVLPTYSTTVNIYDSSGFTLLHSVVFSGSSTAPVASLSVSQNGCTISCGDQTSSWDAGSSPFFGFKLTAGSPGPTYKPGLPYTLPGGGAFDAVINLYVADSEASSGEVSSVISGFFGIFIDPVMAFFSAEFVPGFSLGRVCLFSFLTGLLFWFLKVS